ncbi:unnamed protein product [Ilex paraguariensis]|uniref:BOI-related E3 ubiquitin-protein ligase 3 n=1 Tax=Ilex paraguariensis TaxID=185542 RepID=A0ABC8S9T1_9AQUA
MAIQAQFHTENLGFPSSSPQDWMDNGCGFNDLYVNLHQQQKQHHHQIQNQPLQYLQQRNHSLLPKNYSNDNQAMGFPQTLAAQFEKQRQEIDFFISLQNEKLRLALQAQRKQQIQSLLKKYESKIQFLLGEKDEEMAKAVNRTLELENFLNGMEVENQTWQRLARENEAMVMSLNTTIEQLRQSACLSSNGVEDAESCCDMIENRGDTTEEESEKRGNEHEQDNAEQGTRKMMCKNCNSRNSCIIFLPCRHLCTCKDCEAFFHSCPVCGMVKKAGIEALF